MDKVCNTSLCPVTVLNDDMSYYVGLAKSAKQEHRIEDAERLEGTVRGLQTQIEYFRANGCTGRAPCGVVFPEPS